MKASIAASTIALSSDAGAGDGEEARQRDPVLAATRERESVVQRVVDDRAGDRAGGRGDHGACACELDERAEHGEVGGGADRAGAAVAEELREEL